MDVYIYFVERLPVGLDAIEDALDVAFEGLGEVIGSGIGKTGSNLDLSIQDEKLTKDQAIAIVRNVLEGFSLPVTSRIVVENERFSIR